MHTDIKITYVNKSHYQNNSTILIYMQPSTLPFSASSTAWQVIKNIGYNCWHKFVYPLKISVLILWSNNGKTEILSKNIMLGASYSFEKNNGNLSLVQTKYNNGSNQFDVINNISMSENISVIVLKGSNPIQVQHQIASKQKAVFVFNPKLYFAICSEYEIGKIICLPLNSTIFTEIDLIKGSSLSITLRGNEAKGYKFMTCYNNL